MGLGVGAAEGLGVGAEVGSAFGAGVTAEHSGCRLLIESLEDLFAQPKQHFTSLARDQVVECFLSVEKLNAFLIKPGSAP